MKRFFLQFSAVLLTLAATFSCSGRTGASEQDGSVSDESGTCVTMVTDHGTIRLRLYDKTPLHRDNFIRLASSGFFDSLLFHRVIRDFMIQAGDPDSRNAAQNVMLGSGGPGYRIPAEFRLDEGIWHRRGALAAAREGDAVNPDRESSASQFYIVWGKVYDDAGLDAVQERLDAAGVTLTPEMRETYRTAGGTPHLDGQYTVFGEVVDGLDVVESIQRVATDIHDRPLENVRILSVIVDTLPR